MIKRLFFYLFAYSTRTLFEQRSFSRVVIIATLVRALCGQSIFKYFLNFITRNRRFYALKIKLYKYHFCLHVYMIKDTCLCPISILTDLNNATLALSILFGACKIDLSRLPPPPPRNFQFYITYRSKAILLLWFHLVYVLESNFCAV